MLFCNVSFLVFASQDDSAVIGKLKGAVEALHACPQPGGECRDDCEAWKEVCLHKSLLPV